MSFIGEFLKLVIFKKVTSSAPTVLCDVTGAVAEFMVRCWHSMLAPTVLSRQAKREHECISTFPEQTVQVAVQ
jgi:hypothetical protein